MQSILYIEITSSKWKVPLPLCCAIGIEIFSGIPAGEASPFKTLVTRGGAILDSRYKRATLFQFDQ